VIFYVLNADSSQYADALISRTAPVIGTQLQTRDYLTYLSHSAPAEGGSVAEWLACWTQAASEMTSNVSGRALNSTQTKPKPKLDSGAG